MRCWKRFVRSSCSLALGAALLLGATTVRAQTYVSGGQFRQNYVADDTLLRKGRLELGLTFAGLWTLNRVTPDGAAPTEQQNTYLAPALVGGYMLTDALELRLTLGLQYLQSGVGASVAQETISGAATVQALYQKDLVLGIALYAGVGVGGFYGWRNVPAQAGGYRVRYDNMGGIGQLLVGLLFQPGPRLMLRGGLRFDVLAGSESPEDATLGLPSQSMLNVQVLAELGVGIRFN